eukprot:TRINITY_DN3319_c0_g2_i2.p1 TRINITY_DN3319_c0_g2~~TRINITY_DN3319_c0_g2_i2.p1  ORF type:complete len:301 (+),score=139.20 TRINITY_DN3319_c0_g2_i2:137-1039(+)
MLELCGVPPAKFRPICSAIDKLDKEEWETVKIEMVQEKGLAEEAADKIGEYVSMKNQPKVLFEQLKETGLYLESKGGRAALDDLEKLFQYLEWFGVIDKISFDLSLARGLDYYTGVIYEAVFTDNNVVGSVAAGGRYDKLVGMFSNKGDIPAVGVSIGIERIFAIMERKMAEDASAVVRDTETEVYVASIGDELLQEKMEICAELWSAKIKTEFPYKKRTLAKLFPEVLGARIPFMVVFGSSELENDTVNLKIMSDRQEVTVKRSEMVETLLPYIEEYRQGEYQVIGDEDGSSSSSSSTN